MVSLCNSPATVRCELTTQFFAHERGFYIGMYALVLFGSNYVAPIVAGVGQTRHHPLGQAS